MDNSSPQPPVIPENKSFNSITWIFIFILIFILCSGGMYFLQNKKTTCTMEAKICPDGSSVGRIGQNCEFTACPAQAPVVTASPESETQIPANWKTYINDEYGFQFQYPQDLQVFSIDNGFSLGRPNSDSLVFQLERYPSKTVEQIYEIDQESFSQIDVLKDININGYFGKETNGIISGVGEVRKFYISRDSDTYTILIDGCSECSGKEVGVKILSTFKFNDSSQTIDTSNWKTYTDNNYHIAFKYPSGWLYKIRDLSRQDEKSYAIDLDPISETNRGGPRGAIMIVISDKDPFPNWEEQYFDEYKKEQYQIGNVSGYKISGIPKGRSVLNKATVILAKINNNYLMILNNSGESNYRHFDQILFTFKFLP